MITLGHRIAAALYLALAGAGLALWIGLGVARLIG